MQDVEHPAGDLQQPRQCLGLFCRGKTVRTAVPVALVVGTVLALVNQSYIIAQGRATLATWVSVALDYCVPFLVSSFGYLAACRRRTL